MPSIVIEEALFDPEMKEMPAVDPSVSVPSATESETKSDEPAAAASVPAAQATTCEVPPPCRHQSEPAVPAWGWLLADTAFFALLALANCKPEAGK